MLLLVMSLTSCDGAEPKEKNDSLWISTEYNPGLSLNKLDETLQGKWHCTKSHCSFLEDSGEDWEFKDGLCIWNEFTNTYSIKHDSLFVAGMTFIVQLKGKNIVLHHLDESCNVYLSAR